MHFCPACLRVGGGGLREAAKSWTFHLSRGLRATLYLFKFSSTIKEGLGNKVGVENKYSGLGFLSGIPKSWQGFQLDAG
jgi:hypothetical protein